MLNYESGLRNKTCACLRVMARAAFVGIMLGGMVPTVALGEMDGLAQKFALLERFLRESSTSKRIADKGSDETRNLLIEARKIQGQAEAARGSGDTKQATAFLDQAMKIAIAASRKSVDPASRQWLYRAQYEDLSGSVREFKEAYQRHLESSQPKGSKPRAEPLDQKKLAELLDQGAAQAKAQKFQEANAYLKQAQTMLVDALRALIGSTSIVYELKFDTPEAEYLYEVRRGESFATLIRMVLADGQKSSSSEPVEPLVMQSDSTSAAARQQAVGGDFKSAIKTQEKANSFLVKALRSLGVMIPF